MSAVLEWRGVRCVRSGTVVIAHLDLAVRAGERVALIGPNGAGKTTLFQLACGLLRPQAGSVRLRGRRIDRMAPHRIAALSLARSFQAPQVFLHLSVRDNLRAVLLARAHADEATDDWLDALGLAAVAERTAGTLDGTLLRLLDLGLALIGDAPVLLLDEPTAGLARDQADRLLGLIESRAAGRTLLLIEHDLDVVFRLARRIVVLHHGAVLADGTPEAIRADREVQSVYLLGATETAT